jgi:cyclic pyranopterin phosphate synthase
MPLDASGAWRNDQVVPQTEILERIGATFPLEPIARGHEPAERFRYLDGQGEVGVIPSVTRPFCEQCDRIRLTADGQLRSCLFSLEDHDLRGVLRAGGTDDDLSAAIEACVGAKWAGHAINQVQFVRPGRSMSQIGG